MIIFLLILGLVLFISGLLAAEDGVTFISLVLGIVCFVPSLMATIVTINLYVENISTIKNQESIIIIQRARVKRLTSQIKEMAKHNKTGALLNADSPIRSIVNQLARSEQQLSEAEEAKVKAKMYIDKTKLGMFWFIHSIYGVDK